MNFFCSRLLAVAALALPLAAANAADVATGWVPTATQALALQNPALGTPAAASMPLNIAVALRLNNAAQLASFVKAVNTPGTPFSGQFMTAAQFTAAHAPSEAQAQSVANYLRGAGFGGVTVAPNRLLVSASGTVAAAQRAFHTSLTRFTQGGHTYFINTQAAQVPASLGGAVLSVMGLNNLPALHTNLAVPSINTILGLSPQALQKAYNAGSTPTGSSTAIAIFAFGDMSGVVTDLRQYESQYGLPAVPVSVVKTGAGPWSDDAGRTEWDMDTQTSTGIAGSVQQLLIYNGSSLTDVEMAAAFNRFVTDNTARGGSVSVSECEVFALVFGTMAAEDQIFQQAASQGQTIFASSGDTGPTCYNPVVGIAIGSSNGVTDSGIPGQGYPASSPYIIAAGGTTLTVDSSGNYDVEIAWNAGGGGHSVLEPSPDWQAAVLPVSVANSFIGKGVPDVAMDADFLLSPAALVVNGADSSNGGTSLSSPLALGAWARIQSAHGNALGFAGPALYALATPGPAVSTVAGFHDITVGNNGLYPAHPGWDYTTGLGTFDISAVNALVN